MIFSYFNGGIKDTIPSKTLTFNELVNLIKHNPKKDIISEIIQLRMMGDDRYKILKETLPNITPNCTVKRKKLSNGHFHSNFINFSNYLYFDIDDVPSSYKEHIISKYGNSISLVSISSSGGGISILVKVSCLLTEQNFKLVWYHIRNGLFKDENIDVQCCNISRAWFIPYDMDVFVNEVAEVIIDTGKLIDNKNANQGKMPPIFNTSTRYINTSIQNPNILKCSYLTLDIKIVLENLKLQSTVPVINKLFDFNPEYVCKVFVPNLIPDNEKRITYRALIHQLVYINPDINPMYIFSYLNFVNNNHANPKMTYHKLIEFFNFVYYEIQRTGVVKPILKLKRVHFNENSNLTRESKVLISNRINGLYRRIEKIDMIIDAKDDLQTAGKEITTNNVSILTGIKRRTVQLYFNCERIDFEMELRRINDEAA